MSCNKLQWLVEEKREQFDGAMFMGERIIDLSNEDLMAALCTMNSMYLSQLESRSARLV